MFNHYSWPYLMASHNLFCCLYFAFGDGSPVPRLVSWNIYISSYIIKMLRRHMKGPCFVHLYTRAASPVYSLEGSGFFIVFHTCVLVLPLPYMAPKMFQARSFIAITLGLYYPQVYLKLLVKMSMSSLHL